MALRVDRRPLVQSSDRYRRPGDPVIGRNVMGCCRWISATRKRAISGLNALRKPPFWVFAVRIRMAGPVHGAPHHQLVAATPCRCEQNCRSNSTSSVDGYGFRMKSQGCSSPMADSAWSLPYADATTTFKSGRIRRNSLKTSRPCIPGKVISRRTTSITDAWILKSSSALLPSLASITFRSLLRSIREVYPGLPRPVKTTGREALHFLQFLGPLNDAGL
jgi:hypothetical protein